MNVGEISFCGKIGFNINNDEFKQIIIDDLEKVYGVKIIARHYEKFDMNRSVDNLNKIPHLLCLRSNGNPYFLHLVRYNFTQYCIFIDKKIQHGYCFPRMVVSRLSFEDELFDNGGTLLEGEMISGKNGVWYFVILDLLVHKGRHMIDLCLPKRINALYKMLQDQFVPDESDICKFLVKKYFSYNQYELMTKHVLSLPYTTRGIIFRPFYMKFRDILYNFDDTLIVKVERKKVGTFVERIDSKTVLSTREQEKVPITPVPSERTDNATQRTLLAQKTSSPDVYAVYDPKTYEQIGTACIQGLVLSKKMRNLFASKNCVDKVPLEFVYNNQFNKWSPIII